MLEDLGSELVVAGDPPAPIEARYEAAADLLAALHAQTLPPTLPVEPGVDYRLPPYDIDALLIEAELLLDWYLPRLRRRSATRARTTIARCGATRLRPCSTSAADLGAARLSFAQFAVAAGARGHRAHRPARFPGRGARARRLRRRLAAAGRARRRAGDDGDRAAVALHARAACRRRELRRARIRARLCHARARSAPPRSSASSPGSMRRDGKPQYLRHMPRVWGYLQRALAHPALAPTRGLVPRAMCRR